VCTAPSSCPSRRSISFSRQHHWQPLRALRARNRAQFRQRLAEHLFVKEDQGIQGLTVGAGRYLAANREIFQEGQDPIRPDLRGITIAAEEDEAAHPGFIGLLGADRIPAITFR